MIKITEEIKQAAVALVRAGKTQQETAVILGISKTTVGNITRENGIVRETEARKLKELEASNSKPKKDPQSIVRVPAGEARAFCPGCHWGPKTSGITICFMWRVCERVTWRI